MGPLTFVTCTSTMALGACGVIAAVFPELADSCNSVWTSGQIELERAP